MEFVWQDRKRTIFGLPWSFTRYSLTKKCLYIKTGLLTTNEDEVRLYRIVDISLRRSLGQRLFGLGTILCHSSDETLKTFEIKNIKAPEETKNMLSELIEEQRLHNRVYSRETIDPEDGIIGDIDGDEA